MARLMKSFTPFLLLAIAAKSSGQSSTPPQPTPLPREWKVMNDTVPDEPCTCLEISTRENKPPQFDFEMTWTETNSQGQQEERSTIGIIAAHPTGAYVYASPGGAGGTLLWDDSDKEWTWMDSTPPFHQGTLKPK